MAILNKHVCREINCMDRDLVIEILEGYLGVACSDDDSTQELRDALAESSDDPSVAHIFQD